MQNNARLSNFDLKTFESHKPLLENHATTTEERQIKRAKAAIHACVLFPPLFSYFSLKSSSIRRLCFASQLAQYHYARSAYVLISCQYQTGSQDEGCDRLREPVSRNLGQASPCCPDEGGPGDTSGCSVRFHRAALELTVTTRCRIDIPTPKGEEEKVEERLKH